MSDFNIKFSYDKIGKQSAGIRQKVLQSQRSAASKTVATTSSGRQTLTSLKTLNTSILKLIASNKDLSNAIKRGVGGPGRGGGGRGIGAGALAGVGGRGIGGMGSAIPILGAGIAAMGFLIQKINQVGKAYIAKTSEQIGTVGLGGFRRGKGVYTATQMGGGMSEYARATGEFASDYRIKRHKAYTKKQWIKKKYKWVDDPDEPGYQHEVKVKGTGKYKYTKVKAWNERINISKPYKTALDIGAIYGQTAGQALGTAGQFKRAGGDYQKAAYTAAGIGVQTELPMLLTGMANILTDAVREGVNTSDMADDMAKNISALAMKTPGKSVEAALNMVRSSRDVQKQVAAGKMGTTEGLFTAQAAQQLLMKRLTGKGREKYIERLEDTGFMDPREANIARGMKPGTTFEKFRQKIPGLAFPLLRKFTSEVDTTKLMKEKMSIISKRFGTDTAEGRRRFMDFASTQGWSKSQGQLESLMAPEGAFSPDDLSATQKGKKIIGTRRRGVTTSAAGIGIQRTQKLENMLLNYGGRFAQVTVQIEDKLLSMAKSGIGPVTTGLSGMSKAITTLTGLVNQLNQSINKSRDEKGNVRLGQMLKDAIW